MFFSICSVLSTLGHRRYRLFCTSMLLVTFQPISPVYFIYYKFFPPTFYVWLPTYLNVLHVSLIKTPDSTHQLFSVLINETSKTFWENWSWDIDASDVLVPLNYTTQDVLLEHSQILLDNMDHQVLLVEMPDHQLKFCCHFPIHFEIHVHFSVKIVT